MTMTDKQKLQQLFDAALKTPVANEGLAPKRAFPTPIFDEIAESAPAPKPAFVPAPAAAAPQPQAIFETVEQTPAPVEEIPALDKEAAEELGALLDERLARKRRRRKLEFVVTLILFFGSTIGGTAWFIQSPARIQALREAIRDVRSYGDINSMVAKYQEYINKIGVRNQQIDQASSNLGIDLAKVDRSDETMDAEFKQMMGGQEGKTLGDRNKAMHAAFGDRVEKAGGTLKANVALKDDEKFNWK